MVKTKGDSMELVEGRLYYVRTARNDYIGTLVEAGPYSVVLENPAWIADSGRLQVFMRDGKSPNMEVERLGDVKIKIQWLEICEWPHKLPETT